MELQVKRSWPVLDNSSAYTENTGISAGVFLHFIERKTETNNGRKGVKKE